ncbi:MAG TPA: NTP transferase domain-containing protein [Clostridia bacterium]|nr:NTP transferase domain-containing protein [Clostridia bacterium]
MYNAIILAGGPVNRDLESLGKGKYEAFLDLDGRPMVSYVVDALLASPSIDKIVAVGPLEELSQLFVDRRIICVEERGDIIGNLLAALDNLPEEKVLVVTCDLPFLTPEAVEDFLDRCSAKEADFYYPIVRKKDSEARFPGSQRTYVHLKEGVFTGGNIFLLTPRVIRENLDYARKIVALRKHPFKLARLLGLKFICKFIFKLLSLEDLERKIYELLHLRGAAIISPYPEIGVDVDKKSDFDLACLILNRS